MGLTFSVNVRFCIKPDFNARQATLSHELQIPHFLLCCFKFWLVMLRLSSELLNFKQNNIYSHVWSTENTFMAHYQSKVGLKDATWSVLQAWGAYSTQETWPKYRLKPRSMNNPKDTASQQCWALTLPGSSHVTQLSTQGARQAFLLILENNID